MSQEQALEPESRSTAGWITSFFQRKNLWFRLLAVGVVALAVVSLFIGARNILDQTTLNIDTALFVEMARVDLHGGTLYVDRWDSKPPVIFWYLEPFIAVFGTNVTAIDISIVVQDLLLGVALGLLAYVLTRSRSAAVVAFFIGALYGIINSKTETTVLMSAFGTTAMALAVFARGRARWLMLAGIAFALGGLSKQPLAIETPVLLIFAAAFAPGRRLRAVLMVFVGLLIAAALLGLWLLVEGNAEGFFRHVVVEIFRYYFGAGGPSLTSIGSFGGRSNEVGPRFLPMIVAALLSLGVLIFQRRRWLIAIVLLWTVLTFVTSSAGVEDKYAYYVQVVPPITLLVALAVPFFQRWRIGFQALLLIGALVATAYFGSQFLRPARNGLFENQQRIVDYVEAHTQPTDCLFFWGNSNDIAYLTGRSSCVAMPIDAHARTFSRYDVRRNRNGYLLDIYQHLPTTYPTLYLDSAGRTPFISLQNFLERYRGPEVLDTADKVYSVDLSSWHAKTATFGDRMALLGYDLAANQSFCPGGTLTTGLTWQQLAEPADPDQVVIALTGPTAHVLLEEDATVDRDTSMEPEAGDLIVSRKLDLKLSDDLAPGTYTLALSLHSTGSSEPLAVGGDGAGAATQLALQDIRVGSCAALSG